MNGIGDAIGFLMWVSIIGICLSIIFGISFIYSGCHTKTYELSKPLKADTVIISKNGIKDTTYIYKIK